jgi:hypothetical protein
VVQSSLTVMREQALWYIALPMRYPLRWSNSSVAVELYENHLTRGNWRVMRLGPSVQWLSYPQ